MVNWVLVVYGVTEVVIAVVVDIPYAVQTIVVGTLNYVKEDLLKGASQDDVQVSAIIAIQGVSPEADIGIAVTIDITQGSEVNTPGLDSRVIDLKYVAGLGGGIGAAKKDGETIMWRDSFHYPQIIIAIPIHIPYGPHTKLADTSVLIGIVAFDGEVSLIIKSRATVVKEDASVVPVIRWWVGHVDTVRHPPGLQDNEVIIAITIEVQRFD